MTLLIFDFDGTLANSLTQAVEVFNTIAPQYKLPLLTPEQFQQLRHMEYKAFIKMIFRYRIKLPMIIRKIRKQLKTQIEQLKPVAGISPIIKELYHRHHLLGILTSNSKENVELFIEFNKLHYFNFIYSEDNLLGKSSKLKKIVQKSNLDKTQIFYIGDEIRDIIAAKQAGIQSVAVTWGLNSKEILQTYKPDFLIETPEELLEINFQPPTFSTSTIDEPL